MERLRCGVIFTDPFLAFLGGLAAREAVLHPGEVLALDYIRCVDGARAGQSWLEWMWVRRSGLSEHCFFRVAGLELYLSPPTQQGLKHRYLDMRDGKPFVG